MNDVYNYICLFGNKIQRRKSYYFFVTSVKYFYLNNTIDVEKLKLNLFKKIPYINYDKLPNEIIHEYISGGWDVSIYEYVTLDITCNLWILDHWIFMKTLCDHYKCNI